MIQVNFQTRTAQRVGLPSFLLGLLWESLEDLTWTAPELGVQHLAWWPEVVENIDFDPMTHVQDGEILTPQWVEYTVKVTPRIVALSPEVIAAKREEVKKQMVKAYENAAVRYLDTAAQSLGYDDIKSAVGYAEEPVVPKFQADGQALRRLRSLVWAKAYSVLGEVESGDRAVPTLDEFEALLPKLGD